ncbi:hypothetical protein [Candidatus Mycalebacterium sp.]
MKKPFSFYGRAAATAAFCILFAVLAFSPAPAQEKGGPVIEESGYKQEGSGTLDTIRKYVFLNLGSFTTPTGRNKRYFVIGNGGFDFSTDNFQAYFEGRIWKEKVQFEQACKSATTLTDGCDNPGGSDVPFNGKRTLEIETDTAEVSEAYLSYSPFPQFNVKVGRRKVIWGQFDIFSPVFFFTLPIRTQNISTNFSKVNFALPQDNVQISILPHERVELQGYFFLNTIIDPLLTGSIRVRDNSVRVSRKDLQDHNQYAARAIFYPDWATIALTYYNGRNGFSINSLETLGMDAGEESQQNFGLSELQAYSIEATVPRGRWNFRGELSYRKSEGDLESFNPDIMDGSTQQTDYFNWAMNQNGGRLYADTTTLLGGLGVEYVADRWKAEIAGYFLNEEFTGSGKRGADLSEAYANDDPAMGLLAAPFVNAAYYITGDKQTFVGLTGGFLGSYAYGGSLYGVVTFDKFDYLGVGTLQLVAGLDFLQYFADSQLSDLNNEGGQYDFEDEFVIAPRFGVTWRF